MKKYSGLPLLFFVSAIVLMTSCSKTNKEGRYIPKTSSVIVIINGESLSAKLPWEELKQSELFKQMYADSNVESYIKAALDNPENTGIDTKKNIFFFAESKVGYAVLEATIKDAAKFEAFSSNVTKAKKTEQNGISILASREVTATWDKDKCVIVMGTQKRGNIQGSENGKQIDQVMTASMIYALDESNSMAKDGKFTELVSKQGDIRFWVDVNSMENESSKRAARGLVNTDKLTEGSFLTGAVNFENGKIAMDLRSYSGKDLTKINKEYGGSKINTEMIKRIPAKNPAMLFTLSFKPEGLLELLKMLNLDGYAGIAALKYGFSLDDFKDGSKGDILFALSDIKKDSVMPFSVNAMFVASIADKKAFDKLIKAGDNIVKDQHIPGVPSISYNSTNDYFAIGTDKTSVDKFLSTSNNNNFDFIDKISGSSSAFYLNFNAFNSDGISEVLVRDSLGRSAVTTTLKMWDNILATGEYKDGVNCQHIDVNLADKNTNSLKQLMTYFGMMKKIQQERSRIESTISDSMPGSEKDDIRFNPMK